MDVGREEARRGENLAAKSAAQREMPPEAEPNGAQPPVAPRMARQGGDHGSGILIEDRERRADLEIVASLLARIVVAEHRARRQIRVIDLGHHHDVPETRELNRQSANRVGLLEDLGVEDEAGKRKTWKIVGEDEADAAKGSVSHVSPMAQALFGRRVGDVVTVAGREWEVVALG